MILKEAFRFKNKINGILNEAETILRNKSNVTIVKKTYLYKKANPNTENQTVTVVPEFEYYEHINELIDFTMYLIEQHEILSYKINQAKRAMSFDMDSEISLNRTRQNLAAIMRSMSSIKSSEIVDKNGGVGYCFNNEGNQTSFRCDVENVTTINFDRNKVRELAQKLDLKADNASSEVDKVLITCEIDYDPPFDVNSSFEDIFEDFINKFKNICQSISS